MIRPGGGALLLLALLPVAGCRTDTKAPAKPAAAMSSGPARPSVSPAPFSVFHQDNNTYILVVKPATTDPELAALVWQLRDAAAAHGFDGLHLSQAFIDARHPKVFFHIYRGSKCATETYAKGPYPCGASYHGSADFSVGGFSNPNATDGALIDGSGSPRPLWSAQ